MASRRAATDLPAVGVSLTAVDALASAAARPMDRPTTPAGSRAARASTERRSLDFCAIRIPFPSIAQRDALQILGRADDRPPHMGDRTVVEAQALLGLAEVAADDVGELVELDMQVGIERVDVVQGDLPARHVPFVIPHPLVILLDVGIELVVLAEQGDVGL